MGWPQSYLRFCWAERRVVTMDRRVFLYGVVSLMLLSRACCHGDHEYMHPRSTFAVHKLQMALENSQPQLQLNSTKFTVNGQILSVTVQRQMKPDKDDLVALYVPADADPHTIVPINWVNITKASPTYLSSGSAELTFTLRNFRAPFIFRLVKNGTFSPVIVAESARVENAIWKSPSQLHLALHADGKSMVAQWVSGSSSSQHLSYWTNSKHGTIQSSSRTYTPDMMCGPPATTFGYISPGYIHRALIPLQTLTPNTRISYRAGSPDAGWSPTFSFITPPAPGGPGASSGDAIKFLVFNDVGQADPILFHNTRCPPYCPTGYKWGIDYTLNSTKLTPYLTHEKDVQLGLLVGDAAYANGYSADWDVFGLQFEPAFAQWPLMTVPGNHERDYPMSGDAFNNTSRDSGGECNVPHAYRYYSPAQSTPPKQLQQKLHPQQRERQLRHAPDISKQALSLTKPGKGFSGISFAPERSVGFEHLDPHRSYYGFGMGAVYVLMLDSETLSHPGSAQGEFVAAELAKVDRRQYTWVVACMHRMMVAPSTYSNPLVGDIQNMERLQADYEELFKKFSVNLVISGHEHAYARTCPWYKGDCVPTQSALVDVTSSQVVPVPTAESGGDTSSWPFWKRWISKLVKSSSSSNDAREERVTYKVKSFKRPTAPVYILAGNAGAGFTNSFPAELPAWAEYGTQGKNGYLRVTATNKTLLVESVSTDDGTIIDAVQITL